MDTQYKDENEWGKQSARDIIAKKKPKSLSDLVKILKTLEKRVEKKHALFSLRWKTAYLSGVEEELTKYHTKLTKERRN